MPFPLALPAVGALGSYLGGSSLATAGLGAAAGLGASSLLGDGVTPIGHALDYLTPDWLHRYSWQTPQNLQGPLAQAAGVMGKPATRARYVTTVQRINPDGSVDMVSVDKGKPYLTRQDMATCRKVKRCKGKINRMFPSPRKKTTRSRRR